MKFAVEDLVQNNTGVEQHVACVRNGINLGCRPCPDTSRGATWCNPEVGCPIIFKKTNRHSLLFILVIYVWWRTTGKNMQALHFNRSFWPWQEPDREPGKVGQRSFQLRPAPQMAPSPKNCCVAWSCWTTVPDWGNLIQSDALFLW